MSFLDWFRGEKRGHSSINSDDPYLANFLGQRGGMIGSVDADRAGGLSVAHACVAVISQSLAAVPLNLYRRSENGGREKATDHTLFNVLRDQPTQEHTAFEVREFLIASLMMYGNAYARPEWNRRGQVMALYPIDPSNVAVERLKSGRLRYRVTDQRGAATVFTQDEILHLRYRLARDGVMGLSPLQIARATFNLALTQQETAGKQAVKGFRPEGALVFPNQLNNMQKGDLLGQLRRKIEQNSETGGIFILDGGVEWKPLAFSSKDAEFLDSRKLTNLDICRIWNVPPTVVGITDNATYSNTDQESRALVVRCLAPMARRVEQVMNVTLLSTESRKRMFIEHDLAGLLRGDLKARYEAYRIGREWGWLSPNEIRGWENLPEIDSGQEYLTPLNMTPLGERTGGEGDDGA